MKKAIKIITLLLIAGVWMTLIYKLSGMNSKNSNGKSIDIIGIFIEDTLEITNQYGITNSHPTDEKLERASMLINAPMRKVIHASVYFVLCFFMMILLEIIFENEKYIITVIVAVAICVLFAATDEFHQTFVSGRNGQIIDVLIDTAGAIVGMLFYTTYHIVYRNGYKKGIKNKEEKVVNTAEIAN